MGGIVRALRQQAGWLAIVTVLLFIVCGYLILTAKRNNYRKLWEKVRDVEHTLSRIEKQINPID